MEDLVDEETKFPRLLRPCGVGEREENVSWNGVPMGFWGV